MAEPIENTNLHYVSDNEAGFSRQKNGKGFVYLDTKGHLIRDKSTREWIESIVIPPAWQEVWISPHKNGHILATGRDDKGRAFVLTALSATRDRLDYQRVVLTKPALVLDENGPDELRISGADGVFHEQNGKLELAGGVRLSDTKNVFDTAASLFDTKTGEVEGSGPIQGAGGLGEISAKSYGVYDKGDRMVFKGGVHTRLDKQ